MSTSDSDALKSVLESFSHVAIVLHDNPDPDAVASALVFQLLGESVGTSCRIIARGSIGFEENRILLGALGADIKMVEEIFVPEDGEGIALLDNAIPGENNPLLPSAVPDIVIDHHTTATAPESVRFSRIEPNRGSTSSMMMDFLKEQKIDPDAKLASGLLYGMMVDTHGFVWNMSEEDYENLSYIAKKSDTTLLEQLERPPLDVETLDVLGRAIQNREVREGFCLSWVDYIQEQDAISRAGDFLLRQKGVHTTLVYGIMEDNIYISARTSKEDIDLGEILREAFQKLGFAGGHAHAAGARIPMGLLGFTDHQELEEKRTVATIVKRAISSRFLDTVGFLD